jgi:hypothetical protein
LKPKPEVITDIPTAVCSSKDESLPKDVANIKAGKSKIAPVECYTRWTDSLELTGKKLAAYKKGLTRAHRMLTKTREDLRVSKQIRTELEREIQLKEYPIDGMSVSQRNLEQSAILSIETLPNIEDGGLVRGHRAALETPNKQLDEAQKDGPAVKSASEKAEDKVERASIASSDTEEEEPESDNDVPELEYGRLQITKEELDNILLNLGDLLGEGEPTDDFQNAPLGKEQVELATEDKTVPSADKPAGSVAANPNKQRKPHTRKAKSIQLTINDLPVRMAIDTLSKKRCVEKGKHDHALKIF